MIRDVRWHRTNRAGGTYSDQLQSHYATRGGVKNSQNRPRGHVPSKGAVGGCRQGSCSWRRRDRAAGTGPDLRPWKARLGAWDKYSRRNQGPQATHLTFGTRPSGTQGHPWCQQGGMHERMWPAQTFPASPVRDAWHYLANDACAFRAALLVWSAAGKIAACLPGGLSCQLGFKPWPVGSGWRVNLEHQGSEPYVTTRSNAVRMDTHWPHGETRVCNGSTLKRPQRRTLLCLAPRATGRNVYGPPKVPARRHPRGACRSVKVRGWKKVEPPSATTA